MVPSFQTCAIWLPGYTARCMNVYLVILGWIIMAAVLATGVVMAVNGTFWVLIVGLIAFVGLLTKFGIYGH
jgi:hypothetical protein